MGYLGTGAAFVNNRLGFMLMTDKGGFSVYIILGIDCYIFVLL
jgi:hypothetical protein